MKRRVEFNINCSWKLRMDNNQIGILLTYIIGCELNKFYIRNYILLSVCENYINIILK